MVRNRTLSCTAVSILAAAMLATDASSMEPEGRTERFVLDCCRQSIAPQPRHLTDRPDHLLALNTKSDTNGNLNGLL